MIGTGYLSPTPDYDLVSFTPDALGRTSVRIDQQGDTCTFTHDLAGRLTRKDYAGHASGPLAGQTQTDTFTFEGAGRMLTAVSGRYANTAAWTYEVAGRKATESLTIAGRTYTVSTAYDAVGRVATLTHPDGRTVSRTYTDRGQLATIATGSNVRSTRTYDAGGRLASEVYDDEVSATRGYTADNTLSGIDHSGAIDDFAYTWDANHNKTAEAITGVMAPHGFDQTVYDAEDRLTGWATQAVTQTWTLSAVGHWQTFTGAGGPQSRVHGDVHELLSVAGRPSPTALRASRRCCRRPWTVRRRW